MRQSAHPHPHPNRGPARARTTVDQDIVACVMATLITGEHSSRFRDGEEASRGSIAMVETWRVTLDHIRQRLLGHGTGVVDERSRSRSPAERGALATASRVAPAFGGNGYRIRLAAVSSGRSMVPRGPCAVGWAAAGGSLPTRAGGSSNFLRSAHANGANGSTVVGELALRRDSHPKPECHRRRVPRYEARRLGYWF
jgi:hypothetical protein